MSIIIRTFCYYNLKITLLLSLLFLIRGHNYPGGGFIGALVAITGIGFYTIVYEAPPKFINNKNIFIITLGGILLIASSLPAVFYNYNFLKGVWLSVDINNYQLKLGTPLLFDIGIYLSIVGSLNWIVTYLENKKYD